MIRNTLNLVEKTLDSGFSLNVFSWIQQTAPRFSVKGDQVSVITQPETFYQTLLKGCQSAKQRIMLASLYLGTGPLEHQLLKAIESRLKEVENFEVSILIDANRGSRGTINSRKMLMPLLKTNKQCQISLFHTPTLRGPLKYILPQRYNELVGLQHMKLYLFDDSVIVSGANLSEDYFTNRQDRYILIDNCKELADFYWELVQRISSVSLALDQSDNLAPRSFHPYKTDQETYVNAAKDKIWGYYKTAQLEKHDPDPYHDTWIYPLLELPPLGIHQDSIVTKRLLEYADEGSNLTLSTGYFNLTEQYTDTIIQKSKGNFSIIMAHPSANGFLTARGLASGIPNAYTGLALRFLSQVSSNDQSNRISMWEYQRPNWTYHAKGIWYTLQNETLPSLTLIGSSNYGFRSVGRDIENQIVLVTTNQRLRERLKEEEDYLKGFTTPFTTEVGKQPNRKPALWILTTMKLFKDFF